MKLGKLFHLFKCIFFGEIFTVVWDFLLVQGYKLITICNLNNKSVPAIIASATQGSSSGQCAFSCTVLL